MMDNAVASANNFRLGRSGRIDLIESWLRLYLGLDCEDAAQHIQQLSMRTQPELFNAAIERLSQHECDLLDSLLDRDWDCDEEDFDWN